MRNFSGWVVGAIGVGVVAGAFFLGGRMAAADLTPGPAAAMASGPAQGLLVECEPGQRAVLRQAPATNQGAASVGCVGPRTVPATYIPAATNRPAMAPRSGAVRAPSAPRAPVSRPRSVKKSVAIIAGSTAAGAVIGGVTKGKKGAVIGGIVGGAAATIWDQITRRKTNSGR